jgi:hypothetical protein
MSFCCTSRELFVLGRNGKQLLDMTLTCVARVDGNHVHNALVLRKQP